MVDDLGPYARLIEDHRQNQKRLAGTALRQPRWALPIGFIVPWILVAGAVAWRGPIGVVTAVLGFIVLAPIGLACLFFERLQPITAGLVLGMGGALFTAAVLFG